MIGKLWYKIRMSPSYIELIDSINERLAELDSSAFEKFESFLDNHPPPKKIAVIAEKILHAHPYDNSDIDDLIKDTVSCKQLSSLEMVKRKMKYTYKTIIFLITSIMMLVTFGGSAYAFNVPAKPDNGWYVRDDSGKINATDMYALNSRIETFNRTTKNEIGVLITPTLDGASLEDTATDVFKAWGVGKTGLDNGILIMVVSNDRKIRIETGKGAEGDVTDSQVPEITGNMKPYLRSGNYAGAINIAITNITSLMESRANQKTIVGSTSVTPVHQSDNNTLIWVALIFCGVGLGIGLCIWYLTKDERKPARASYSYKNYDTYTPRKKRTNLTPNVTINPVTTQYVPIVRQPMPVAKTYVPPPPMPRSAIPVAAGVVAGVVAGTVAVEAARAAQKKRDEERKKRDTTRRSSSSSSSPSTSTYGGYSSGGYDSGSSGGGYDGGGSGFGGGDSGGGGGSDSF